MSSAFPGKLVCEETFNTLQASRQRSLYFAHSKTHLFEIELKLRFVSTPVRSVSQNSGRSKTQQVSVQCCLLASFGIFLSFLQ